MFRRDLGTRTGAQVSALGLGCWAIGGPWTSAGQPAGWGEVDDDESIRAIRRALELGVTLFDTADVQHELSVLRGELEALAVAEELGLASLNRTPLPWAC